MIWLSVPLGAVVEIDQALSTPGVETRAGLDPASRLHHRGSYGVVGPGLGGLVGVVGVDVVQVQIERRLGVGEEAAVDR